MGPPPASPLAPQVCDALFRMVSHSARLVETQEAVRSTVDSRLQVGQPEGGRHPCL